MNLMDNLQICTQNIKLTPDNIDVLQVHKEMIEDQNPMYSTHSVEFSCGKAGQGPTILCM